MLWRSAAWARTLADGAVVLYVHHLLATYLQVAGGLSRAVALLVSLIALIFAAAICPLAGLWPGPSGRRVTVMTACVLLMVVVYLVLDGQFRLFAASVVGVMLLAVGGVMWGGHGGVAVGNFPHPYAIYRLAITYNMAYTIFGGTAPLMATWLISTTGSNLSPAFYLIAVALLALAGGLALPETSRNFPA